jgi:hypothetical protein
MSKRRNRSFNDDLQNEFKFIELEKLCSVGTKAVCQRSNRSNVHFSVAHGGRSDINQHLRDVRSQEHKVAGKTLASVKNISSFMVRCGDYSESDKIAVSEALVAYIVVTAKVLLANDTNDCLSTLVKNIYEPKFSSARTKSETVITNVLSPYILGEVIEDLNKTKSNTVILCK